MARAAVSRQSDDEYRPPKLFGRPLIVGPAALAVAALVVVPLVVLGSGESDDEAATEQQAARSAVEPAPTPPPGDWTTPTSVPGPLPPPSAPGSTSPTAGPKDKQKAKEKDTPDAQGGARSTVTVTAPAPKSTTAAPKKKKAPKKETAATAVGRLARKDPSGRHICYRAYVAGQGWQKPVCDGAVAGTTGQHRMIKALNIAVSGVGGSAANAFVHSPGSTDGQGVWKPKWTAVAADGKDNYIGSTASGAPNMIAFAVNIGKGQICQIAHVRNEGWKDKGCAGARPGLTSGGSWNNDVWLEAVRFTV
ncbi:hypothetical protein HTV45_29410 [Streptomyces sp. CHD11]|nr:hypothetical protein [Streptomyces sp. CHD11]